MGHSMKSLPYRNLLLICIALFLLGYFIIVFAVYLTHPVGAGDYTSYYRAVEHLDRGEALYSGIDGQYVYLYPPLFAQILSFITVRWSLQQSANIWYFINVVILILTLFSLSRFMPTQRSRILLWITPPLFTPVFNNFLYGQVTIVLFALIVWAWMAYQGDYPVVAGILIAIAAWIKIYPVVIVGYFVWKRDWRVLTGVILLSLAVIPIQIIGVGWDNFSSFFTSVLMDLSSKGQVRISFANHSIYGFAVRLFGNPPYVKSLIVSPLLVEITRWGLLFSMGSITLWSISHKNDLLSRKNRFTLEYSVVILMMLFASTSVTPSGPTLVIFSYVALAIASPPKLRKLTRSVSLISIFLISAYYLIVIGHFKADKEMPALIYSTGFIGMLMLWVLSVYILNFKSINQTKGKWLDISRIENTQQ